MGHPTSTPGADAGSKPKLTSRQSTKERKKRWAPKARSGCTTCRSVIQATCFPFWPKFLTNHSSGSIRRIKCDEEKPACKRCTTTGRKCDGYESTPEPLVHQPRLGIAPPEVKPSWEELQVFHFFRNHVVQKIAGAFDRPFWTVDLLRATQLHPALWYACNAVAATYRKYTVPKMTKRVVELEEKHQSFALVQYNASIKALVRLARQKDPSPADKLVILTATVLYTGFCSLRGDRKEGFIHTRNGLNLFQQWRIWDQVGESQQILPVSSLVTLFNRLDTQALSIMDDRSRAEWSSNNLPRTPSPEPFTTVTDAYFEFELLLNGLLDVMQDTDFSTITGHTGPLCRAQLAYRHAYDMWSAKFAALQASGSIPDSDREALLSMQIRQIAIEIAVKIDVSFHELSWDKFQPQFDKIVRHSEELLANYYGLDPTQSDSEKIPAFSFGASVSEPLYLIALNCRDQRCRRKATELLRRWPRREGIWDSTIAATVAEALMELEEDGAARSYLEEEDFAGCECLPGTYICRGHRVLDTNVEWFGEGTGKVTLRTVNDVIHGRPGKTIELAC